MNQGIKGLDRPADPRVIIAMGASTGGTEAIFSILSNYTANMPGFVIVQHMPEGFTGMFARRIDGATPFEAKEACDGDGIMQGRVLIAPGGKHMMVSASGEGYKIHIREGAKVNGHRPSVDVLFESVAQAAGSNAIGVILTGMGSDGAKGLRAIRESGGYTIGQDERSSVVYGMPMAAYLTDAVTVQLPLYRIADEIINRLQAARNTE